MLIFFNDLSLRLKFNLFYFSLNFFISNKIFKIFNRNLNSSTSNPNNNDFNRYTWFGLLITFLLYILTFFVSFKSILLFYIIFTFIYIIFLALELIIFLLFINKKFSTPSYLPDYLRNWFLDKENIAQSKVEVVRIFLDLYIKDLLVYVLFFIILIVFYLFE